MGAGQSGDIGPRVYTLQDCQHSLALLGCHIGLFLVLDGLPAKATDLHLTDGGGVRALHVGVCTQGHS